MCTKVGGCHRKPVGCKDETCFFHTFMARQGNSIDSKEIDFRIKVKKNHPTTPNWIAMELFRTESITGTGLFFLCHEPNKVKLGI